MQHERASHDPTARSRLVPALDRLSRMPYWLLLTAFCGVAGIWVIISDADYRVILRAAASGVLTTIYVSLAAFALSVATGLVLGLLRVSRLRLLRELATFWVEIVRGIPMLVILYYIAFVGAPGLVAFVNWLTTPLRSAHRSSSPRSRTARGPPSRRAACQRAARACMSRPRRSHARAASRNAAGAAPGRSATVRAASISRRSASPSGLRSA